MRPGLVLNPKTQLDEAIEEAIQKGEIETVLIMSVGKISLYSSPVPGFGGQKFMPQVLKKVRRLRKLFPALDIMVDGGVKLGNIDLVARAGANQVVSGSGILKTKDQKETISKMREILVANFCREDPGFAKNE